LLLAKGRFVRTMRGTPCHFLAQVVLEIDGAEADLTIIDLPGIIHDHPAGRQYVELVEQMTRANLAPEHHIIAMALPAGLDPETQVRAEGSFRWCWWA
jgi:hypothetical protein